MPAQALFFSANGSVTLTPYRLDSLPLKPAHLVAGQWALLLLFKFDHGELIKTRLGGSPVLVSFISGVSEVNSGVSGLCKMVVPLCFYV